MSIQVVLPRPQESPQDMHPGRALQYYQHGLLSLEEPLVYNQLGESLTNPAWQMSFPWLSVKADCEVLTSYTKGLGILVVRYI